MFVYWGCLRLRFGDALTHMETYKINTGGEIYFFYFFKSCFSLVVETDRGLCEDKKEDPLIRLLFLFYFPFLFKSGSKYAVVCFQSLLCN